jgi:hypothetical protein
VEGEEEEQLEDVMEGDVLASSQPSTLIHTPTPTHTNRRPLSKSRPSTVRGQAEQTEHYLFP